MESVDNIGLDRVQSEEIYDFKSDSVQGNNPNLIYNTVSHSCEYYEIDEFQNNFSLKNCFSTLSHNVRSLPGKWDDFQHYVNALNQG